MNGSRSSSTLHRAGLALLVVCAGVLCTQPCRAQEDDALAAPVSRYVKACALHLAIPAQWKVKVAQTAGHCKVTAELPQSAASLCGVYDDGDGDASKAKTFCDDAKRIVIDVQPGSIVGLTHLPGIGDPADAHDVAAARWGDFVFDEGIWRIDATFGNYRGEDPDGRPGVAFSLRETKQLPGDTQAIVYAERNWRKHFQEGSYCCTAATWEALIDLPGARFAWIEMQWGENEKNVTRFLQTVK